MALNLLILLVGLLVGGVVFLSLKVIIAHQRVIRQMKDQNALMQRIMKQLKSYRTKIETQ